MTDAIKPMQGLSAYLRCEAGGVFVGRPSYQALLQWANEVDAALAALRAQPIDMEKNHDDYVKSYERAQPDHSELVKRLRDFDFGASDVDEWIEIMDEAANALEGKAIEGIAMTDKELLEKAARAAGHEVTEERGGGLPWTIRKEDGKLYAWNPLTDDGDALRLAVKLRIKIVQYPRISEAHIPFGERVCFEEPHDGDPYYAATRRAIVRAAAAIGETME